MGFVQAEGPFAHEGLDPQGAESLHQSRSGQFKRQQTWSASDAPATLFAPNPHPQIVEKYAQFICSLLHSSEDPDLEPPWTPECAEGQLRDRLHAEAGGFLAPDLWVAGLLLRNFIAMTRIRKPYTLLFTVVAFRGL